MNKINSETTEMARVGSSTREEPAPPGFCTTLLFCLCYLLIGITFPLSIWFCFSIVTEYQKVVIFRLGRTLNGGAKGPGIFFFVPCLDDTYTIDMRTITIDVPPQEVLTKDSVSVTVDAVMYYRVFDPTKSVTQVTDAKYSSSLLAATTLRNILGTKTLHEILSEKDYINNYMKEILDKATDDWGVKIERVELSDVKLPQEMQRAMATEAEASRNSRAKVIAAEGEQKASLALKEAADHIDKSPIALQLRYLQTLTHIAAEKNSTIVFPIPIEFLNRFKSNQRN